MGLRPECARGSIRLSLARQNTEEDVDLALALLPETVARLRELSPSYGKHAISS
jgi:cysteine desulfurase